MYHFMSMTQDLQISQVLSPLLAIHLHVSKMKWASFNYLIVSFSLNGIFDCCDNNFQDCYHRDVVKLLPKIYSLISRCHSKLWDSDSAKTWPAWGSAKFGDSAKLHSRLCKSLQIEKKTQSTGRCAEKLMTFPNHVIYKTTVYPSIYLIKYDNIKFDTQHLSQKLWPRKV